MQQILFSPTTTLMQAELVMETQLSQESTNSEEDGREERVIAIACNTCTALDEQCATRIPGPNRRLL